MEEAVAIRIKGLTSPEGQGSSGEEIRGSDSSCFGIRASRSRGVKESWCHGVKASRCQGAKVGEDSHSGRDDWQADFISRFYQLVSRMPTIPPPLASERRILV